MHCDHDTVVAHESHLALVTQWRALSYEGEEGITPKEPCRKPFEQVNCIMQRLRSESDDWLDLKHR